MDNMKMVNLYTDFNMMKRVNRLAMTLSLQTVTCFSHCDYTFIKFRANSYSTTGGTFITFRAKIYYT